MTTRFAYYCTKIVMMHFCSIFPNKYDSLNMGKLSPKSSMNWEMLEKVDGKKWNKSKKVVGFFPKGRCRNEQ